MNTVSLASRFEPLGQAVEQKFRRQNYNSNLFPEIAIHALTEFNEDVVFRAIEVAHFIAHTSVVQQPKLKFSDLPITVYRGRHFYIEILVWTKASTAIHQHAFSGAFKVLQGGSLHSGYLFDQTHTVSPDLLIGDISRQFIEYLSCGDIRGIYPGNDGLVHSLFHLENPSLTLVARTYGHARYQPQYTLYPPHFAVNEGAFVNDSELMMYARLLHMSRSLAEDDFEKIWLSCICNLDFPRFFYFYLKHFDSVDSPLVRHRIVEEGMNNYGELMNLAVDAQKAQSVRQGLVGARENISDSDQRYFLALLLFCQDRKELTDLIKLRYQGKDAEEYLTRSILALISSEGERLAKLNQALRLSGLGGMDLGRKIVSVLPKLDNPDSMSDLLNVAFKPDRQDAFDDGICHQLGISKSDLKRARAGLQSIEALTALFR